MLPRCDQFVTTRISREGRCEHFPACLRNLGLSLDGLLAAVLINDVGVRSEECLDAMPQLRGHLDYVQLLV